MSQLDDIKKRAEVNAILGQTASQDEAKDTLKLVAALEAVETLAVELIEKNQHDTSFQAWGLRVAGRQVRKAIEEALA